MANVGFIGAGNMGLALIKGYSKVKPETVNIFAYDVDRSKEKILNETGAGFLENIKEVAVRCKYVVLACKPQQLGGVLAELAPAVTGDTVLVSICAGISETFIKGCTGKNAKVVLVMPNTPMMINKGASAAAKDVNVTAEEFDFVKSIIASCGIAEEIPIDKMKEIIAVNGSSPAFIYLYAQCFIDYAVQNGIDAETAKRLFAMTLTGAGEMILSSGMSVDKLIEQVSSKGGTTVAGLEKLRGNGIAETVKKACEACTARAYELDKVS